MCAGSGIEIHGTAQSCNNIQKGAVKILKQDLFCGESNVHVDSHELATLSKTNLKGKHWNATACLSRLLSIHGGADWTRAKV